MLKLRAIHGLILSLAASLFSLNANAYDVDTHFYGTYLMARYAGIAPGAASKIATSAQWMDESYLSDPTSMLLLPITGVAKRRLLHFPASRVTGILAGSIRDESYGITKPSGVVQFALDKLLTYTGFEGDLRALAVNQETEPNHEFANALIMRGLKEGDLMKAGTGLHTLEDSYAHAGTAPILGHEELWHWPDRPFAATGKYKLMTATVFKALVAIRAQLPADELDCSLTRFGAKPTCQMDARELQNSYIAIPDVMRTVSYNVLKSPEYVRYALNDTFRRASQLGYFKERSADGVSIAALLESSITNMMLIGRSDTYTILDNFINKLLTIERNTGVQILDHEFLARDMGLVTDPHISLDDFILSQSTDIPNVGSDPTRGNLSFDHLVTRRLLEGYVPIPLDDQHKQEHEDDKAVTRKFEMALRIKRMQTLIKTVLNEDIEFVENSTATDDGFAHEILADNEAETKFERTNPATTYITFSAAEKRKFDVMIFTYLFPHLTEANLVKLTKALRVAKLAGANGPSIYKVPLTYYEYYYAPVVAGVLAATVPIIHTFVKDLLNEHLLPVGDEKFYQQPELLARFKAEPRNAGKFPQFLGPADTWQKSEAGLQLKR